MEYLANGFKEGLKLIISLDREFLTIVFTSLKVSIISTSLSVLIGVPLGILLSCWKSKLAQILSAIINTLMSLPTVVVGLIFYSLLSRQGPLGSWGLLYSITAIVLGQFVLSLPIVIGLTMTAIRALDKKIKPTLLSLGAGFIDEFKMLIHEAKFGITAAVIAGFSRVFAEIGVSMMLGGNIKDYTRTITTAIALETSKGEFALGLALGLILLTVAFMVNLVFSSLIKQKNIVYVYN